MDDSYQRMGSLPFDTKDMGAEGLAKVMAKSILELVIPVVEKRCTQLAEEIVNGVNKNVSPISDKGVKNG